MSDFLVIPTDERAAWRTGHVGEIRHPAGYTVHVYDGGRYEWTRGVPSSVRRAMMRQAVALGWAPRIQIREGI